MSSSESSFKRTSERSDVDEVRSRLQRAYMVMIRSYLRRHRQEATTPSASIKEMGDV
jgi:hypothetical protein